MQNSDNLHKAAHELTKQHNLDEEGRREYVVPKAIVEQLPDDVKFKELLELLELLDVYDSTKIHENILLAEACLRHPTQVRSVSDSKAIATRLEQWTISVILPGRAFARKSHFEPRPSKEALSIEITRWRAIATVGLQVLLHLHSTFLELYENPSLDLVTCLASLTDGRDTWTSPEATKDAHRLLKELCCVNNVRGCKQARDLIRSLLEQKVKPYFARTKNSAVTKQGRKAISNLPDFTDFNETEVETKPWKFQNIYIITVFRWILSQLDVSALEENWPLIIPPLLAILDDEAIDNKVKGCELLVTFLRITPPSLLQRTGLGEVFHEALMPCLSYLPTLTPEEESLRLLSAVYPTLLILIRAKYPEEDSRVPRLRSLDRVLRSGVLRGYSHAGEYVRIGEMLVDRMADLVKEMGIWSVKHLKDLVPLLSGILSSPFSTTYTPLLRAATRALDVIILNGWPRVSYYRGDILKGLAICWCRLQQEQAPSKEFQTVANQLQQTSKLLVAALNATNIDVAGESAMLIESNASLKDLLEAPSVA